MKVIHKGLEPAPEIKAALNDIQARINEVIYNNKRHLADVGIILGCIGEDLLKISEQSFEKHKEIRDGIN